MESKERRISVFVCREEKLVFGVSKRTTCADVVKVLLEDQNLQRGTGALSGCAQSHRIVEKWRGFQRVLPDRTKILRLWDAWGDEQRNVRFMLVRGEASWADRRARSAEARVVLSKQSPSVSGGAAQAPARGISPEKQRRVVRKAFRKLEKINRKEKKRAQNDASSAERMETLAHLVISQDLTVRQQIQRIAELDTEIESCEARVHLDRIKRHGINYVQDTYLVEAASIPAGGDGRSADLLTSMEEYACLMEKVVRLQEELSGKEALVEIISLQLREELDHSWMRRRRESQDASAPSSTVGDAAGGNQLLLEADRIRTELDASSYIGLRLCSDLEAVRANLELAEEICAAMEEEVRDLLERVEVLEADATTGGEEGCSLEGEDLRGAVERKGGWEEAGALAKGPDTINDDDSDTGLSSLHSQDSDSLPVWESPV
uniref:Ras association domain family member 10 n=2 Tax=Takifugu rubripes TaxID=31033 RepID=A0A674PJT1_TAKRU